MDYDKNETPQWYVCSSCSAGRVRLYRQFNIFLSNITLLCTACGLKRQKMQVPDGKHTIGWLVAAVPTEDESTYWGYSSVPDRGVTWWNELPVEPAPSADTTGYSTHCRNCARRKPKAPKLPGKEFWRARIKKDCCKEWSSVEVFSEWYLENRNGFAHLRKRDESLPHSPLNSYFSDKTKGAEETFNAAVEFCMSQGMNRTEAIHRVQSVSRQRMHQMVRATRGICRQCDKPIFRGWFCEEHYEAVKAKNRKRYVSKGRVAQTLEIDGQSKTIREWSRATGVPAYAIRSRLRIGWDAERAVNTPVHVCPDGVKAKRRAAKSGVEYLP